jgi:HEAT repeat protein
MKPRTVLFPLLFFVGTLGLVWGGIVLVNYARAQRMIRELPPERIIPALQQRHLHMTRYLGAALHNADTRTKVKAAYVLGRTRDCRAVPHLVKGLSDVKTQVQMAAKSALIQSGRQCKNELFEELAFMGAGIHGELLSEAVSEVASADDAPHLRSLFSRASAYGRAYLADVFVALEDSAAVSLLRGALDTDNTLVLTHAIRALGEVGTPSDAAYLAPFTRFSSDKVQTITARALGRLQGDAAVSLLLPMLDSVDTMLVRAVVSALGRIGTPRGCMPLVETVKSGAPVWHYYRDTVTSALRRCCINAGTDTLRMISRDGHARIRAVGIGGLGKKRVTGEDMQLIVRAARQDAYTVRARAIQALGNIGNSEAYAVLCSLLYADTSVYIRRDVVQALGRMDSSGAFDHITGIVRTSLAAPDSVHQIVVQKAIEALEKFHKDSAGPLLRRVLVQAHNEALRCRAARALGRIQDTDALDTLVSLVQHGRGASLPYDMPAWDIRRCAARAIAAIGDTSVVPALLRIFPDIETKEVRIALIDALGQLQDRRAISLLRDMRKEQYAPAVRTAAGDALRTLHDN